MKLLIAGLALLTAIVFVASGNEPEPVPQALGDTATTGQQVDVHVLRASHQQDVLTVFGQARARWQISLRAETSGRVTQVADAALVGALVQKGDVLAEIENTGQQLDLANRTTALATARRVLAEEEQRARIAQENWDAAGYKGDPDPLVLRLPQLEEARADLNAARLAADRARYVLDQTRIVAPFDGAILKRSVGPGDLLQSGDEVVELYDTQKMDVVLTLTEAEAARLSSPIGNRVRLIATQSGREWQGVVERVGQRIDATNRWIELIVSVKEPNGLLPGQFLRAEVDGRSYEDLIGIPRALIGRDGAVWHVDFDNQLRRMPVIPVFSQGDRSFVAPGSDWPPTLRLTPPSRNFLNGTAVSPVFMSETDTLNLAENGAGQ
ncbi:efflux RND transporter periplasmic adaptor subunit [Roseibium sp. RKSG952]|uniref:efflux RND transporter periplasmic adaptor subunit n=1 Tax=Roseibium sp. RKSG952 TaxID=2529384 RepID=UPI0018AD19A3|nr:efflux RND transporter periplasmic adaptor subunit [Roseibium sp. RKSG952]